jgi:hypothetical protein
MQTGLSRVGVWDKHVDSYEFFLRIEVPHTSELEFRLMGCFEISFFSFFLKKNGFTNIKFRKKPKNKENEMVRTLNF